MKRGMTEKEPPPHKLLRSHFVHKDVPNPEMPSDISLRDSDLENLCPSVISNEIMQEAQEYVLKPSKYKPPK